MIELGELPAEINRVKISPDRLFTKDELQIIMRVNSNQINSYFQLGIAPIAESERLGAQKKAAGSYRNSYSFDTLANLLFAQRLHI